MRQEISLSDGSQALSHYTDAVRFTTCYSSPASSRWSPDNNVALEDVLGQTDHILSTMDRILARAGAGFADVLRTSNRSSVLS